MTQQTVWILGDQLLTDHPALAHAEASVGRENVRVVMVESAFSQQRLPYHRQKIVLVLSAMRHYAADLREQGYSVDYRQGSDAAAALQAHVAAYPTDRLVTMAAATYRGRQWQQQALPDKLNIPVDVLPNRQFLVEQYNPIPEPEADKRYVLEHFYRDMRRHFDVLMDGDDPVGGEWNFDKENRKSLPKKIDLPEAPTFAPDETTQAVIDEVSAQTGFVGSLDGFGWAVTRSQALAALDRFVTQRFADFGRYEDAMTTRSATLFHSVLSPYLNLGLLQPLELIRAAEQAYRDGHAPINSVEGFIRQILGWREFMYWQYWRQMPDMKSKNQWQHTRPLPDFFWTGETDMRCMQHVLARTLRMGYAHHIERLMILGNFAFVAGLDPAAVNDWFSALFVDATDWVMPPNVIGMSLNADGGLTATKPYFSSANYINKMSDYCGACRFDHKARTGENACPFNTLYWHFVLENEDALRDNPRTVRMAWGLRHLDDDERASVRQEATALLDTLSS